MISAERPARMKTRRTCHLQPPGWSGEAKQMARHPSVPSAGPHPSNVRMPTLRLLHPQSQVVRAIRRYLRLPKSVVYVAP